MGDRDLPGIIQGFCGKSGKLQAQTTLRKSAQSRISPRGLGGTPRLLRIHHGILYSKREVGSLAQKLKHVNMNKIKKEIKNEKSHGKETCLTST